MNKLEFLIKIVEELKNMTPEQEEQFKKDIEKLAEKYKSEEVNWLTPEKKQALKSLKGSVKLPIDYFDLKYWDEDESEE